MARKATKRDILVARKMTNKDALVSDIPAGSKATRPENKTQLISEVCRRAANQINTGAVGGGHLANLNVAAVGHVVKHTLAALLDDLDAKDVRAIPPDTLVGKIARRERRGR